MRAFRYVRPYWAQHASMWVSADMGRGGGDEPRAYEEWLTIYAAQHGLLPFTCCNSGFCDSVGDGAAGRCREGGKGGWGGTQVHTVRAPLPRHRACPSRGQQDTIASNWWVNFAPGRMAVRRERGRASVGTGPDKKFAHTHP